MKHRRDLYLAILHEPGASAPYDWAYAVVTDGDLAAARGFASRDAAVMELRRSARSAPLGSVIDLGRPGVVAERIAGMTERPARARSGDRQTSHDAARSINPDTIRGRILWMLRNRSMRSDFTLADVVDRYRPAAVINDWPRASDSSIRTRVSELVDDGFVEATGERARLRTGRSAALFRLSA